MRKNTCIFLFFFCSICLQMLIGCGENTPERQPPKVAVVPVLQKDVPIYGEIVGQTIGSLDIDIRTRVDGQLEGMHFKEGQPVKKGDLLYSIDPRPYETKRVSVEGTVAEARTKLAKADADLKRVKPLAKINAVSKRDLDAAIAARGAAQAALDTTLAQLEYADIELSYTKIHSPIDGLIGISKARVGDYVGKEPNPVVLNTISNTNPIHVRANFSESLYLSIARRYIQKLGTALTPESKKNRTPLHLRLSDGSLYGETGVVHAVDSQIDPLTGTLAIEAAFPNDSLLLRPGQFAKLRFITDIHKDALIVWQRAVQEVQDIYQIYVVNDDNSVEIRNVTVGERVQGAWIITSGVKVGERIIVDGIQKARAGSLVTPLTPKELQVTPPESPLLSDKQSDQ